MTIQIKTLEKEINEISLSLVNEFGNLSEEELNWKPNSTTWSIAQNIDHIIAVNKTYWPIIEQVKNGTYQIPFLGKISLLTSFFGKFILNSVQPDRKTKIKTFKIWEPSTSTINKEIINDFKIHQEELIKLIVSSEDLLAKNTIISSPVNRNIVYSLEKAFEIIISHEKRHLNQAKEVLAAKTNS